MTASRTRAIAAALVLAAGLAGCSHRDIDLRAAAAGLVRSACQSAGSCSVTCADGSTLDGRPVYARCR